MTEWNVLLVLGELLGLFLLVGKPLMNLNATIATIIAGDKARDSKISDMDDKNHVAHKEFYDHFGKVDIELADHELRIGRLEEHK